MKWIKLYENFKNPKNIIIVGGGISALYTAYKIKKELPGVKFTILEQNSQCGGRVVMDKLDGVPIHTGAQFIRLKKDKVLGKLLKELEIELEPYELKIDYTFKESNVNDMIKKLKSNIKDFNRDKSNFSEFAKSILKDDYNNFLDMMGYTDFENSDFIDTIQNYGLDDNVPGYQAADVPWDKVLKKLISEIGEKNIIYNTKVDSIKKQSGEFIVNSKFKCDGVVLAVTIKSLKKLLDNDIYKDIESQNFIKAFATSKELKVKNYTVVDSPLRKVLPKGGQVYNIAFSDNADARLVNKKEKSFFEKELSREFDKDIKISNLKKFFWEEGTHYFKPLKKKYKDREEFLDIAQHPERGIWVVGECVSLRQGWVNGALESVENIDLFKK